MLRGKKVVKLHTFRNKSHSLINKSAKITLENKYETYINNQS